MKNLRKLRESNNMTQQQMADKFGIQRPTYSRYENGERQPDFDLLLKISDYFNVSVDYLLGKEREPSSTLDNQLEGVEFALYGEVKELTEQQKQDILDYTRFKKAQWEKQNENK